MLTCVARLPAARSKRPLKQYAPKHNSNILDGYATDAGYASEHDLYPKKPGKHGKHSKRKIFKHATADEESGTDLDADSFNYDGDFTVSYQEGKKVYTFMETKKHADADAEAIAGKYDYVGWEEAEEEGSSQDANQTNSKHKSSTLASAAPRTSRKQTTGRSL